MSSIRTDLDSTRQQLEAAIQVVIVSSLITRDCLQQRNINCTNFQASTKNSISDSEKREKKMLERKLSEMEEELKVRF